MNWMSEHFEVDYYIPIILIIIKTSIIISYLVIKEEDVHFN